MTDTIALTGLVATDPRHIVTGEGLPITTFRLASTQRRFDRANQKWVDADTNWYTISSFRQLAINAAESVKKGERVVVVGRLRIREWQTNERNGMTVDVEAESLGHDLLWGSSTFTRTIQSAASKSSTEASTEPEPEQETTEPADVSTNAEEADDSRPMATLPF